jgi:hypothetical protein
VRVTLGGSRRNGWVAVHPDPDSDADVHLPFLEYVEEHGAQITELEVGAVDERIEPVLPRLVAALPPGTVVRGAGRRDGEREALAASLRRAGLVDVTLSGDDRGARFVATRGGTATEKAETVPENQEGDVRPLVAEETEPDPLEVPAPQGLKARLRALWSRANPRTRRSCAATSRRRRC